MGRDEGPTANKAGLEKLSLLLSLVLGTRIKYENEICSCTMGAAQTAGF